MPKILALEDIAQNISWAKDWEIVCNESGIDMLYLENLSLSEEFSFILNELKSHEISVNIQNAKCSQFHDSYNALDFNAPPLLLAGYDSRATGLLVKTRGGLLDINARAFKNNTFGICTVCNLDAAENTYHFIGVCPIYKRIRFMHFNKITLDHDEFLNILNGSSNASLIKYLQEALLYRKLILNEFNGIQ